MVQLLLFFVLIKPHKIRCRSKKYFTAEFAEHAEIINFFFSAFSAISAVNPYVNKNITDDKKNYEGTITF